MRTLILLVWVALVGAACAAPAAVPVATRAPTVAAAPAADAPGQAVLTLDVAELI